MDPRVYYQGDCQQQPMNTDYMDMQPEYDATIQVDEKPRLTASPEVSGIVRPSPSTGTPEAKKPRNPWGEMSYADLITKAILSAPDKRLTLSEIYAWMIENVPYFREKANETSTSGWKVCTHWGVGGEYSLTVHNTFVSELCGPSLTNPWNVMRSIVTSACILCVETTSCIKMPQPAHSDFCALD